MRILFVCTANRLRSPTAETLFADWPGVDALSAGTDMNAPRRVDAALIAWADIIIAMEATHRAQLRKKFGRLLSNTPILTLGIPDAYERDQPELIELLRKQVVPIIETSE
jgi:predicted protein tyrosine phosphatase